MNSRVTGCASLSEVNSGSIDPGLISEAAICYLSKANAEIKVKAEST
jgi:hypothetical protein